MGKNGKIYIENEGLNTRQYCYANISATKAPIFMKFETQLHKIENNIKKSECLSISDENNNPKGFTIPYVHVPFHKDRSFGCGDICNIILTCVLPFIFNVFCEFSRLCPSKAFING